MLTTLTPSNVKDLRLSGQVIYTGKSSMEVVVKWEALSQDHTEETIMLGECRHIVSPTSHFDLQEGSPWCAWTRLQTVQNP